MGGSRAEKIGTVAAALVGGRATAPNHAPFSPEQRDALIDIVRHRGACDEGFRVASACTGRFMYECREEWRRIIGATHNPNHPASGPREGRPPGNRTSRRQPPREEEFADDR